MPVLDVYVLIGMYRMTFSEFARLHGKDERFKAIEKKREREAIFSEYVTDLKKSSREREIDRQHKESARSRTDKCVLYTLTTFSFKFLLLCSLCSFLALTITISLFPPHLSILSLVSIFISSIFLSFVSLYLLYSAES